MLSLDAGRRRSDRDNVRAERYAIRESGGTAVGRSIPMARGTFTDPELAKPGTDKCTGKRHARIPHPRSRRAAQVQARHREEESCELRGRSGVPAGAGHGMLHP